MSDAIQCPSCGKRYAYKPELAGRKVKCKCGGVITVPQPAPESAAEEEFDFSDYSAASYENEPSAAPAQAAPAQPAPSAAPATAKTTSDDGDTWKWWYYVAAGVVMGPLAFWEYGRLTALDSGEVTSVRVNRIEWIVYNTLGATGVLVVMLLASAAMLYFGITKFLRERKG